MTTTNLAEITEVTAGVFSPLHEVCDYAKVAALAADMTEHGWRGAPLVVDGENAFTGSHRIAAVVHLWNVEGIQVDIPYVEIGDLCGLYEVDWADLVNSEYDGDAYAAAAALRARLPREVVDYLGYDVDGA